MSHGKLLAEQQWTAEVEKSVTKKRGIQTEDLAVIEGPAAPEVQILEVTDITVKDGCGLDSWTTNLIEQMPLIMQRQLDSTGLTLMVEGENRYLAAGRSGAKDGDVLCDCPCIFFSHLASQKRNDMKGNVCLGWLNVPSWFELKRCSLFQAYLEVHGGWYIHCGSYLHAGIPK